MPSTSRIARDTADASRHLSERVMQSAHEAVDGTREFANSALDSADSALRDARGRIDPAIAEAAASAQRLARRGIDLASDTGVRAQRSLQRCAHATERYVAEQPVRAVLIAAAVGAVVAALALATTRKRRHPDHY